MAKTLRRQFDNQVAEIIGRHNYTLNAISRSSGISHTYLTKLIKGDINRPGKDKLASILLALNFSIAAINAVLADYDYLPLDERDIPSILDNNRHRLIDGTYLPLYDRIYARLLLACMENGGGTKILARSTPSVLYMPAALYHKDDAHFEDNDQAKGFYEAFALALLVERKRTFVEAVHRGECFETYICKECLEEYLRRQLKNGRDATDPAHHLLVVKFFANALGFVRKNPDQHRVTLGTHCPYFIFQLQEAGPKKSWVCCLGKSPHRFDRKQERMHLQGFASAHPSMVELFRKETQLCRTAADQELMDDYPRRLIGHIRALFAAYNLEQELEEAMNIVVETGVLF